MIVVARSKARSGATLFNNRSTTQTTQQHLGVYKVKQSFVRSFAFMRLILELQLPYTEFSYARRASLLQQRPHADWDGDRERVLHCWSLEDYRRRRFGSLAPPQFIITPTSGDRGLEVRGYGARSTLSMDFYTLLRCWHIYNHPTCAVHSRQSPTNRRAWSYAVIALKPCHSNQWKEIAGKEISKEITCWIESTRPIMHLLKVA